MWCIVQTMMNSLSDGTMISTKNREEDCMCSGDFRNAKDDNHKVCVFFTDCNHNIVTKTQFKSEKKHKIIEIFKTLKYKEIHKVNPTKADYLRFFFADWINHEKNKKVASQIVKKLIKLRTKDDSDSSDISSSDSSDISSSDVSSSDDSSSDDSSSDDSSSDDSDLSSDSDMLEKNNNWTPKTKSYEETKTERQSYRNKRHRDETTSEPKKKTKKNPFETTKERPMATENQPFDTTLERFMEERIKKLNEEIKKLNQLQQKHRQITLLCDEYGLEFNNRKWFEAKMKEETNKTHYTRDI